MLYVATLLTAVMYILQDHAEVATLGFTGRGDFESSQYCCGLTDPTGGFGTYNVDCLTPGD